jgi:hypothetical protein
LTIQNISLSYFFAHWDNSPNNPSRIDSTKTVRWGDQSWDEMLGVFIGVIVDRNQSAKTMMSMRQPPDRK